jgi:3-isopropylmalate dehydrogenase
VGSYRIAVMEGDGIGPEITREAIRTLSRAAAVNLLDLEFRYLPVGLAAYEEQRSTLPQSTLEELGGCEGWILGPLTTHLYDTADPAMPNPSGTLRKSFELFSNVRPARSYPGLPSLRSDVDLVMVRENTEGFYADRNVLDGPSEFRPNPDLVISMRVVSRKASLRVAQEAFELARGRRRSRERRPKVTAVHKANVLRKGDGLFLECCREVASRHPEVEFDDYHADAVAMYLLTRPADFDVIVTTNLFGDVLSDEAAGLVGGLGLAPGLNIGEEHAMAQATHGSAPDIAGKGIANPIALILSGALLLSWLGHRHDDPAAQRAAEAIERAVEQVTLEGAELTPDLGGSASTAQLGKAIAAALG